MRNTITIYKPNGDTFKTIEDPETYDFDDTGMLVVNYHPNPAMPTQFSILRTTLPFVIESTQ